MTFVKKWTSEWWAEQYKKQLSENIKFGRIVFNGHYKDKFCDNCGHDKAQILFTPFECHTAKLCCANCGKFYKWISKNESKNYSPKCP